MERKETPEERIDRLNKEFDKLLVGNTSEHTLPETTPQNLSVFGLTFDEAKAWLKREPRYPTDRRKFTENQDRRGLDRTVKENFQKRVATLKRSRRMRISRLDKAWQLSKPRA
jgi:hypothetical protein